MCTAAALAFLRNFRIPDTAFNWTFCISFLCINNQQNRPELLLHICAVSVRFWGSHPTWAWKVGFPHHHQIFFDNKDFLFSKSNTKPFKESVILSNISALCALPSDQSQAQNLFHAVTFSGQAVTPSQLRCTSVDRTQAAPTMQTKRSPRPFPQLPFQGFLFFNWYWHCPLITFLKGTAKEGMVASWLPPESMH